MADCGGKMKKVWMVFGCALLGLTLGSPLAFGAGQPEGTLTATPNPCTVKTGEDVCKATIKWTSKNASSSVAVYVNDIKLWSGASGSKSFKDVQAGKSYEFALRDKNVFLAKVTVTGRAQNAQANPASTPNTHSTPAPGASPSSTDGTISTSKSGTPCINMGPACYPASSDNANNQKLIETYTRLKALKDSKGDDPVRHLSGSAGGMIKTLIEKGCTPTEISNGFWTFHQQDDSGTIWYEQMAVNHDGGQTPTFCLRGLPCSTTLSKPLNIQKCVK
jgi:hypothetical protein